jgi:hypothetical protein
MTAGHYQTILEAQIELAFCLPEEAHNLLYARDEACRELVLACRNPNGPLVKNDYLRLGSALLFLAGGLGEAPGLVALPLLTAELCQALDSLKAQIQEFHVLQCLAIAEGIIAQAKQSDWKHAQRRQALETVIKDLPQWEAACPAALQDRLHFLLAQAYLERSRIIRPRGFTIPPRKKEALDKALAQLAKVAHKNMPEFQRLQGDIFLELGRLEAKSPEQVKECLAEALLFLDPKTPNDLNLNPVDCRLIVGHARLNRGDTSYLDLVLQSPAATALDQAWAAYLLNDCSRTAEEITAVLNGLHRCWFSHPDWEGLVDLLVDWARSGQPGWEAWATQAWKVAQTNLANLRYGGCHLRWYWSRHQDLYDLAFHAAADPEAKARVADSLKSRPLVRLALAEQLARAQVKAKKRSLDEVELAQLIEQDAQAYANQYISGGLATLPSSASLAVPPSFTDLPGAEWLAVHLYLSSGAAGAERKNQVYAMVYDATTKKWELKGPYNTAELWQAYRRWQENYAAVGQGSAPELVALCRQIGTTLPFLWELPAKRPVVFIPHGFLHRLPLHMAIHDKENELEIWAASHPSTYLPAWELRPTPAAPHGTAQVAAVYLPAEPDDADEFKTVLTNNSFTLCEQGGADIFRNAGQARRLCVVCHGLAHAVNPFAAKLLLPDAPQLVDLLTDLPRLPGTQVFLAACEADMAPAQEAPLDEHLSLAAAFLQKGAQEVLGGLYRVSMGGAIDLLEKVAENGGEKFYKLLWDWHKDEIQHSGLSMQRFYTFAVWRSVGLGSCMRRGVDDRT